MRNLGRVLLFILAALMFIGSIPNIIGAVSHFNSVGWQNVVNGDENIAMFIVLVVQGLYALTAFGILMNALTGKVGLFTGLFGFIMLAAVIAYFVITGQNGGLNGWENILTAIFAVLYPLLYAVGVVLIVLGPKNNTK